MQGEAFGTDDTQLWGPWDGPALGQGGWGAVYRQPSLQRPEHNIRDISGWHTCSDLPGAQHYGDVP